MCMQERDEREMVENELLEREAEDGYPFREEKGSERRTRVRF